MEQNWVSSGKNQVLGFQIKLSFYQIEQKKEPAASLLHQPGLESLPAEWKKSARSPDRLDSSRSSPLTRKLSFVWSPSVVDTWLVPKRHLLSRNRFGHLIRIKVNFETVKCFHLKKNYGILLDTIKEYGKESWKSDHTCGFCLSHSQLLTENDLNSTFPCCLISLNLCSNFLA